MGRYATSITKSRIHNFRSYLDFGRSIRPSFRAVVDDQFRGIYVSTGVVGSRPRGMSLPKEDACF